MSLIFVDSGNSSLFKLQCLLLIHILCKIQSVFGNSFLIDFQVGISIVEKLLFKSICNVIFLVLISELFKNKN